MLAKGKCIHASHGVSDYNSGRDSIMIMMVIMVGMVYLIRTSVGTCGIVE